MNNKLPAPSKRLAIQIRVSAAEKAQLQHAATLEDLNLSAWARQSLLRAAKQVIRQEVQRQEASTSRPSPRTAKGKATAPDRTSGS